MTNVKSFCRAAENLAKIDARLRGIEVPEAFIKRIRQWESGLFRLVVMGEFKRGKSSFINAMLGRENLLPACAAVATSVVYKICYGKELQFKVFFTKESGKESLVVPRDEIEKYGTEDGNPDNRENVDFILVQVPSPILRNGLVIIDTPGLGGVKSVHKKIAYEYVPKADAVLLVTRSDEAPIGESEIKLLSDIKKITQHIYFVQTFSAQVDGVSRDVRKDTNIATLTNAGFVCDPNRYFVVDSNLKCEADKTNDIELMRISGFDVVMGFINSMIKNVESLIVERGLFSCYSMIESVECEIEERKKILTASSHEAITSFTNELKNAEDELTQWKKSVCPNISKELEDRRIKFSNTVQDKLSELDSVSDFAQAMEEKIKCCNSVNAVKEKYHECEDCITQTFTDMALELGNQISSFAADSVNYICEQCKTNNVAVNCEDLDIDFNPNKRDIKRKDELFGKARATVYGGMAGTTVAAVVGGALGGVAGFVIAGPAGAVAGAKGGAALLASTGIGTAWGAYKGLDAQRRGMADAASNEAISYIRQSVAKNHKAIQRSVSRLLSAIKSQLLAGLNEAIVRRSNELSERRALLEKMARNKDAEIQGAKKELQAMENDFHRCIAIMKG